MSRSFFGGATTTLRFTPMITGLVCGIVMGDVKTAMEVSAAIQLIYMGVFSCRKF
ncbi:MAG: PTS sugar transporter subunit IIC [Clostridiales bacterium]|nr:PTS sugar transporter subunit IIC [Clostridiales bacterium]